MSDDPVRDLQRVVDLAKLAEKWSAMLVRARSISELIEQRHDLVSLANYSLHGLGVGLGERNEPFDHGYTDGPSLAARLRKHIRTGMRSDDQAVYWIVKTFNENTLVGTVERWDGAESMSFNSTSFQSDSNRRWPRVGERVILIKSRSGALLALHGE